VSGQKPIKMDALRKLYENLGFQNITTYLQSGNVVFTCNAQDQKKLEQILSQQIAEVFGFEVPVIVLTNDKLIQVIDNNPFLEDTDKDVNFLHVTFLSTIPNHHDFKIIEDKKQNGEEIVLIDDAVYLYCPNGYGRTKLTNNFLEAKLKVVATTRNWKTTNELLKITEQIH
ncbi:MAG: DUF1697 domain-containing protein, partial [Paludibacter sp.]